ncbi:MAG: hypothetical protein JWR63_22, partial [Conexibacter sp.]|nr:hypothetical protein [Conexibacter sp.]
MFVRPRSCALLLASAAVAALAVVPAGAGAATGAAPSFA